MLVLPDIGGYNLSFEVEWLRYDKEVFKKITTDEDGVYKLYVYSNYIGGPEFEGQSNTLGGALEDISKLITQYEGISMTVAPLESFNDLSKSFAWGQNETNGECIRCKCGKWMRIDAHEVVKGTFHIRHFEVRSGGDFIGFGCGADEVLILEDWELYNHE